MPKIISLMSDRSITTEHGKYCGKIIVTPYLRRGTQERKIFGCNIINSNAVLGIFCRYYWDGDDGITSVEITLTEKEILNIYKNLKKDVYINIRPTNTDNEYFKYMSHILDIRMEKGVDWNSYKKDFKRIIKKIPLNQI